MLNINRITTLLLTLVVGASFLTGTSFAVEPIRERANTDIMIPADGRMEDGAGGRTLYRRMVALCNNLSGETSLVVPKRYGRFVRLTQVNAVEAAEFFAEGQSGDDIWILACEGDKRFLVEKEYQFKSDGPESIVFHSGRGLEGVNYVKADEDAEYLNKLTTRGKTKKMTPAEQTRFLKNMAREMAGIEMNFVKTRAESTYRGFYTEYGTRCGIVKIEHTDRTVKAIENGPVRATHSYMVCGEKVASLDGSEGVTDLKIKSLVARIDIGSLVR